jgi:hypothetical protein
MPIPTGHNSFDNISQEEVVTRENTWRLKKIESRVSGSMESRVRIHLSTAGFTPAPATSCGFATSSTWRSNGKRSARTAHGGYVWERTLFRRCLLWGTTLVLNIRRRRRKPGRRCRKTSTCMIKRRRLLRSSQGVWRRPLVWPPRK